jgi:WD40 repeat protein
MAERFLDTIYAHDDAVISVNYSKCGRFLISGGRDARTKIWDMHKARAVYVYKDTNSVNCVRFSPDGKMWASLNSSGDLRVFQRHDNQVIFTQGFAYSAGFEFTPDSKHILGANSQGRVFLYSIQNKTPLYVHKHTDCQVSAVAVSPDLRYVASGGSDCIIRLYDMQDGNQKESLSVHKNNITCLAFSNDSKTLASSDSNGMMSYWDVTRSGTCDSLKNSFSWAAHQVNTLAFSPDDMIFATAGHDNRLRLFSVAEKNKKMEEIAGHQRHVYSLCFSPDGKFIASASGDLTIRIWNVKKPHLVS